MCVYRTWPDMFCAEFPEVIDTNDCPHGARNNSCNKLACLNGLNEDCDVMGKEIQYGDCADGLFCACGKCIGCIHGKCSQANCLQPNRHWIGLNSVSYKASPHRMEPQRYHKRLTKIPLFRFGYDYSNGEQ